MGCHDKEVNLINELKTVIAISIVLVEDTLEQGVALPVQKLFRDESVPMEDSLHYLLVGVIIYCVH